METNTTKRTDLFKVEPRNIVVMEGFNVRIDFDLDELKEQIKAAGVLNPITVIPFKDEDGNEKYQLVDGERRYRATMLAIEEGADIPYIKALKAPKDSTPEQLYIEQMMRNEGKPFSEYECAIMFRRFKEELGYSQVQIADKFKKSPAFISKCLSLLNLPQYLQDQIVAGTLTVKAAREIANNYRSPQSQDLIPGNTSHLQSLIQDLRLGVRSNLKIKFLLDLTINHDHSAHLVDPMLTWICASGFQVKE